MKKKNMKENQRYKHPH